MRVAAADRKLPVPGVVAIVHLSDKTQQFTTLLANRLSCLGEQPSVLSDLPCEGLTADVAFESLLHENQCILPSQRRATIKSWASRGRLLLNLTAPHVGSELLEFLNYADKILWCIGEGELDSALQWITRIEQDATWVKDKLSVVWALDANCVPPWSPILATKIQRDFKLALNRADAQDRTQLKSGLERIVHYLRGVQIAWPSEAAPRVAWHILVYYTH